MSGDAEAILVAYGSNLSPDHQNPWQSFGEVVKNLRNRGLIINIISRLWRSAAWPEASDPPFYNAVLQVETHLQPDELLELLHELEAAFGRNRTGEKNAPRTLDLDLIAYGRRVTMTPDGAMVPHPRAANRGFVMGPLAEILPGWVHPVLHRTAADLWQGVTIARDAHPVEPPDSQEN